MRKGGSQPHVSLNGWLGSCPTGPSSRPKVAFSRMLPLSLLPPAAAAERGEERVGLLFMAAINVSFHSASAYNSIRKGRAIEGREGGARNGQERERERER
jgi:hypothetical protein